MAWSIFACWFKHERLIWPFQRRSSGWCFLPSHAVSLKGDAVRIVDDPIEDCLCDGALNAGEFIDQTLKAAVEPGKTKLLEPTRHAQIQYGMIEPGVDGC
jgi:hypothetical protein